MYVNANTLGRETNPLVIQLFQLSSCIFFCKVTVTSRALLISCRVLFEVIKLCVQINEAGSSNG